jgi:ABC-2 type transport system ATP-binding protein
MSAASTLAIEASGLEKSYGTSRAVCGVDLAVRRGSVYGILGPNGAGKTTTIRMLATLVRPDAGEARVLGHDIVRDADAVRGAISLTGQLASVDDDLTGEENLILLGRLLGYRHSRAKARAAELLEAFNLVEAPGRLVKGYSGGMRRRLDIAASIIVTPALMFLDEPTTGLDPHSRNQVWDIVRALAAGGTTILLCTQYLDEADRLADEIAVIDHGRVIAEGTPGQLKASVGSGGSTSACSTPTGEPTRRTSSPGPSRSTRTWSRTPQHCRPRAPTPTGPPRRSASCPGPASGWRRSRSASRPSTRCSSR